MGKPESKIVELDPALIAPFLQYNQMLWSPENYTGEKVEDCRNARLANAVADICRDWTSQCWKQFLDGEEVVYWNLARFHPKAVDIFAGLMLTKGWHVSKEMNDEIQDWTGRIIISCKPLPEGENSAKSE